MLSISDSHHHRRQHVTRITGYVSDEAVFQISHQVFGIMNGKL